MMTQDSLYSMHSTSVYGLELLVLEGTGGKALATDPVFTNKFSPRLLQHHACRSLQGRKSLLRLAEL